MLLSIFLWYIIGQVLFLYLVGKDIIINDTAVILSLLCGWLGPFSFIIALIYKRYFPNP